MEVHKGLQCNAIRALQCTVALKGSRKQSDITCDDDDRGMTYKYFEERAVLPGPLVDDSVRVERDIQLHNAHVSRQSTMPRVQLDIEEVPINTDAP